MGEKHVSDWLFRWNWGKYFCYLSHCDWHCSMKNYSLQFFTAMIVEHLLQSDRQILGLLITWKAVKTNGIHLHFKASNILVRSCHLFPFSNMWTMINTTSYLLRVWLFSRNGKVIAFKYLIHFIKKVHWVTDFYFTTNTCTSNVSPSGVNGRYLCLYSRATTVYSILPNRGYDTGIWLNIQPFHEYIKG